MRVGDFSYSWRTEVSEHLLHGYCIGHPSHCKIHMCTYDVPHREGVCAIGNARSLARSCKGMDSAKVVPVEDMRPKKATP